MGELHVRADASLVCVWGGGDTLFVCQGSYSEVNVKYVDACVSWTIDHFEIEMVTEMVIHLFAGNLDSHCKGSSQKPIA